MDAFLTGVSIDKLHGCFDMKSAISRLLFPFLLCAAQVVSAATVTAPDVAPGGNIAVTYGGVSSPSSRDWIGIYAADAGPAGPGNPSLLWKYTAGTTSGNVVFTAPALSSGAYQARLFANNGYTTLASTSFSIKAATPSPTLSKTAGDIRTLTFNLWGEGTNVSGGFDKIVDTISAADADIVAVTEVRNYNGVDFMARVVNALATRGKTYYSQYAGGDVGVISRYPIISKGMVNDAVYVWHLQLPSRTIAVAVAHLDYTHYAVYGPRGYDGVTWAMIDRNKDGRPDPITNISELHALDLASGRDEAITSFISYARTIPASTPILLLGDFNEASHLDWTAPMANLYDHHGVVIEWGNSKRLASAGFIDSWRDLYPNPVTHPGHTWPSAAFGKGSTQWAPKADERDRIDFIYYRNNGTVSPRQARIIGGSNHYYAYNALTADNTQTPFALNGMSWPSDHKAVLVDFFFTTAAPAAPRLSCADVASGNSIAVSFSGMAAPTPNDWIGIYASSAGPASASVPSLLWKYTAGTASGSVIFPASSLPAGSYQARLFGNNSYTLLHSCAFQQK
jgi:endonuclease/exonuclease/phosphatase family metal-dependent hydrolase